MISIRLFILLALLLSLLAGCGRNRQAEATATAPAASAPAAAPTSAPAEPTVEATDLPEAAAQDAQAAAPTGDPLAVVTNAIAAQLAGGPYRATTTVDADGTITEMTVEIIPPDRVHVVIGGGNLEMIMIDGTLWSKSSDAQWTQMGSPEMMQGILDSIHGQIESSTLSNVQYVGAEPVFGIATDLYSFTTTLGEGDGAATSDVKLWISKESGLPVRMESTGTAMGVTSHTVQSIEYDDTITIEAPAP